MENYDLMRCLTFDELVVEFKGKSVNGGEVETITDFFYRNYDGMAGIVALSRHPSNKQLFGGKTAYEMIALKCHAAKDFPRKDKLLTTKEVSTYMNIARRKKGLGRNASPKPAAAVASKAVTATTETKPAAPAVGEAPAVVSMPATASVEAPTTNRKVVDQLREEGWTEARFAEVCKKYSRVFDPRKLEWSEELADLEAFLFSLVPEEELKMRGSTVRTQGPATLKFGDLYDLLQKVKMIKK